MLLDFYQKKYSRRSLIWPWNLYDAPTLLPPPIDCTLYGFMVLLYTELVKFYDSHVLVVTEKNIKPGVTEVDRYSTLYLKWLHLDTCQLPLAFLSSIFQFSMPICLIFSHKRFDDHSTCINLKFDF